MIDGLKELTDMGKNQTSAVSCIVVVGVCWYHAASTYDAVPAMSGFIMRSLKVYQHENCHDYQ